MLEKCLHFLLDKFILFCMSGVCVYFAISTHLFLNVSVRDATGLEAWGDKILTPVHYLLAGKEAIEQPDGAWKFEQKYDYTQRFWIKTASSLVFLPPSLVVGCIVKGISFCDKKTRERFATLRNLSFVSHLDEYVKMGLKVTEEAYPFISQGHQRLSGDERAMAVEKELLRDVAFLLNQAKIPWWVDCGTCLGAYRYGGVIPWDEDIDVAVLLPDFHNVLAVLKNLDPKKYLVQDWSSREHPNSYIKIYVPQTGTYIDIYHYEIIPEIKQIRYLLSLENNLFLFERWKIRERRFKAPVSFETVFPLRKADFDGVEVFVPNDPQRYLQRFYGENLDPVKVFNPLTGQYEKDLSHPYWQKAYVH